MKPRTDLQATAQGGSLPRLVRSMQDAAKKADSFWRKSQKADADGRSGDARWNEKWADYWKGRRDGIRRAIEIIGPNAEAQPPKVG